ncbi:hypothetical protein HY546_01215 [archaeon]|nr:hypothetical protein [archaeon]
MIEILLAEGYYSVNHMARILETNHRQTACVRSALNQLKLLGHVRKRGVSFGARYELTNPRVRLKFQQRLEDFFRYG